VSYDLWAIDGDRPPMKTASSFDDLVSALRAAKRLLREQKNVTTVDVCSGDETFCRVGLGWMSRQSRPQ
jgi:hypothetical protein